MGHEFAFDLSEAKASLMRAVWTIPPIGNDERFEITANRRPARSRGSTGSGGKSCGPLDAGPGRRSATNPT
jgi:hypothetical protein